MFWRKKGDDAAPGETNEPPGLADLRVSPVGDDDLDGALDALATIVRVYGERGFDVGETEAAAIASEATTWSRHIQLRTPPPGLGEDPNGGALPRDFLGVSRWFGERRSVESEHVRKSFDDLRDVIGTFVDGLGHTVLEDRNAECQVGDQLLRLRRAAEAGSTDLLKQEASVTVSLVERVSDERRRRQRAQIEDLGSRLRAMRGELRDTRRKMQLDGLTQVYNRAALDERLLRQSALGVVLDQPACLLLVDLDHFKWVNDKFGHLAGDAVLKETARCLQRGFLRKEDFVARYGGEEFAVVLVEDSLDVAKLLGERLLTTLRSLDVTHDDRTIRITASIGIARLEPGEDVPSWVERTDRALYRAKEGGRDRLAIDDRPPLIGG